MGTIILTKNNSVRSSENKVQCEDRRMFNLVVGGGGDE